MYHGYYKLCKQNMIAKYDISQNEKFEKGHRQS